MGNNFHGEKMNTIVITHGWPVGQTYPDYTPGNDCYGVIETNIKKKKVFYEIIDWPKSFPLSDHYNRQKRQYTADKNGEIEFAVIPLEHSEEKST